MPNNPHYVIYRRPDCNHFCFCLRAGNHENMLWSPDHFLPLESNPRKSEFKLLTERALKREKLLKGWIKAVKENARYSAGAASRYWQQSERDFLYFSLRDQGKNFLGTSKAYPKSSGLRRCAIWVKRNAPQAKLYSFDHIDVGKDDPPIAKPKETARAQLFF